LKTLHLYLLRQVVATLVMTVLVFTFVLVIGNVLREVLGLMVSGQATLGVVFEAVVLLVPLVVVYALPMGMLTAVLLVFGRFSADQELTAARAGGVSLLSLTTPILILSLVMCGLSAWANMELAPNSRAAYKGLLLKFAKNFSVSQIPEGKHIVIKDYIVFVGKKVGNEMQDVLIYKLDQSTNPPATMFARRATIETLPSGSNVLSLFEFQGIAVQDDQPTTTAESLFQITYNPADLDKGLDRPSVRNMSFTQLWAERRAIENRVRGPSHDSGGAEPRQSIEAQLTKLLTPVKVQMHRQVAFSFACFGFTMIGIPLGIRVQRRETNIGFALAIILVMLYYALVLLGLSLDNHPSWRPHLLLWLPNLLFQTIGVVLLWRANRGL